VILASIHLYVAYIIGNLETDIAAKEARLVVLKKVIGEIDDIRTEKKVLEKKLAVIKRLEEDRLYPVRMLDEVNALVPPKDIRLTKVSEQGPRVSIEGVGRDNIAVALFMKNLELSKYIQSVDLISSKQVDMSGVKVNQFSLSCVKKRS
jgi:type IV pilus assembly protein PilN